MYSFGQTKQCGHCAAIKEVKAFYVNPITPDGLRSWCKACCSLNNKKSSAANPDKERARRRRYYNQNREHVIRRTGHNQKQTLRKFPELNRLSMQKRAGRLRLATPQWLSKDQHCYMRQFYKNALQDQSVDHIIPLVGKDFITNSHVICGLHVPWNLQYLSKSDNSKKGCFVDLVALNSYSEKD